MISIFHVLLLDPRPSFIDLSRLIGLPAAAFLKHAVANEGLLPTRGGAGERCRCR
jgi:hypothetical protein